MAYVLALNDLLKPRSVHRKDFDVVAFLFWLRDPAEDDASPFTIILIPSRNRCRSFWILTVADRFTT